MKLRKKITREEWIETTYYGQSSQKCNSWSYNKVDEDDDTDNNDEKYTLSKSHCKPNKPTPKTNR